MERDARERLRPLMRSFRISSRSNSSSSDVCDATLVNETWNQRRHAMHAFGLALSQSYDQSRRLAGRCDPVRPPLFPAAFVGDRGRKFDHHRSPDELASSQFTIDLRRKSTSSCAANG